MNELSTKMPACFGYVVQFFHVPLECLFLSLQEQFGLVILDSHRTDQEGNNATF